MLYMYQLLYLSNKMNIISGLPLNNVKCDEFKNINNDLDDKKSIYNNSKNIDKDLDRTIVDKKNKNIGYFEENIHLISILE